MTMPNPELIYTLELARSLDRFVREIDATQEKQRDVASNLGGSGPELAFDRAIRRGKEAVIAMLTKATRELVPLDGEEMGKFLRALEYGEIPEGDFFNQPAETPNAEPRKKDGAGCRRPNSDKSRAGVELKKSAEVGARGKMLGGIKPERASLKKNGTDVMDGRARDARVHTDKKPARVSPSDSKKISNKESKNAGKKTHISGIKGSCFPDSFSSVEVQLPSEEKSREVMAQWR